VTPERLAAMVERLPGVALLTCADGAASFSATDAQACSGLVRELFQTGAHVEDMRVQEPNLQSLFLKLTGRELRD
jgi:hypothetical protein